MSVIIPLFSKGKLFVKTALCNRCCSFVGKNTFFKFDLPRFSPKFTENYSHLHFISRGYGRQHSLEITRLKLYYFKRTKYLIPEPLILPLLHSMNLLWCFKNPLKKNWSIKAKASCFNLLENVTQNFSVKGNEQINFLE